MTCALAVAHQRVHVVDDARGPIPGRFLAGHFVADETARVVVQHPVGPGSHLLEPGRQNRVLHRLDRGFGIVDVFERGPAQLAVGDLGQVLVPHRREQVLARLVVLEVPDRREVGRPGALALTDALDERRRVVEVAGGSASVAAISAVNADCSGPRFHSSRAEFR
jgi:hypothetical protein